MLAGMGSGCESFKRNSLTCNLWQKDPCCSISEQAQGGTYIHSTFTRSTLTPFALVGDAAVIGLAIGAGCVVEGFAEACEEGAQNGGRIY
jgi:hypothetical protein